MAECLVEASSAAKIIEGGPEVSCEWPTVSYFHESFESTVAFADSGSLVHSDRACE